jgi:Peptidase family M28.
MFSPKIVDKLKMIYNIGYLGFALIPMGIVFGLLQLYPISYIVLGIGLLITFAMIVFLLTCELGGKYTNGANDNGSGASLALAIADYYINNKENFPKDVEVIFLFTGSEETGERGMKYFLKRYKKLLSKDTQFIVLDNLGAGKLTYLEGEGMIFYKKAGKMLIDIADEMRKEYPNGVVQKRKNLLLPTDALPVLANGFCGITFISMDENGKIKNYHWFTDTIDNVDSKLLRYEESFLIEYILRVSKKISSAKSVEAVK